MTTATEHLDASPEDIDAITAAALDYLEGYVTGDAARHARAYHPEAIKRRFVEDDNGVVGMMSLSPQTMADYAGSGLTIEDECEADIFIDAVYADIASVRIYSCNWVDFAHIVKARGEWRLLHVTWHRVVDG